MNWVWHGGSTTFETRATAVYTVVARLGFKRRATAVLKSNLIRSIDFGTAEVRRLKRALIKGYGRRWVSDDNGEMQKSKFYTPQNNSERDHALFKR